MKFSTEEWLKRYVHFLIKFNPYILIFFLVLVGLSIIPASRIQFKTTFQDLLPPKAESVRNIEELSKIYGGEGASVLVLKGRPIPDLVAFADALAPRLEKLPTVSHVSYKLESDFFVKNALLFIDLKDLKEIERRIKKKIHYEETRNNPLLIQLEEMIDDFSLTDILGKYPTNQFQKHLAIPSRNMLVVLIKPAGSATDIGFLGKFMDQVNGEIKILSKDEKWSGVHAAQYGRYQDAYEDNLQLNKDLAILTILSMILVLGILMFFYRDIKALLLIFFPLMTGVTVNFAVTQLSIGHLNMLSGFLTGILSGLGLEMGIYLLSRYYEEKHRHPWPRALLNCLKQTGVAALVAAMTTSAAFY
ncbi:MAG: MMPL family transporter, partial [Spirochaetia bacterium]|nr:MMPL family transporter [Spirochaetia bacterium]